jgi:alcohol dehydrogenase, propanol-preferring
MSPSIPSKMRAIQVVEYNKPYKLVEVPVRSDLEPHDLLIKVAVASNCHTDGMVQQGIFGAPLPLIASHEGSGTVVALGPEAEKMGYKVGDRVMAGIPYHPCGKCNDCTGPETIRQYCTDVKMLGVHSDGFLADYARIDARNSTKLPNEITFESAAPLACAGRTIWRGVLQTGLKKGEWVAIVGSGGGLGHLGIQFAKAVGLKVIGIDARDEGLSLSKEYGCDVVLDAREGKEAVVKKVHEAVGQRKKGEEGTDSTICISDHKTATGLACAVTKMHGVVVQIAQPDEISVPFPEIIFRDIKIHGSLICSPEESEQMVKTIAKNGIKVKTNPFQVSGITCGSARAPV